MTNLIHRSDKFVTVHNKCSKNPSPTSTYFANSCTKIRFKQLYLGNNSELIICTYKLSFLTMTNTINSHNTELPPESPYNDVHCTEKKYSTKKSSASPVFLYPITVHTM